VHLLAHHTHIWGHRSAHLQASTSLAICTTAVSNTGLDRGQDAGADGAANNHGGQGFRAVSSANGVVLEIHAGRAKSSCSRPMTYTIRLFGLRQPPVLRRNHPVDRRCDPIVRSVGRLTSTRQDTQAPSLESRTPRTSRTSKP
jgi:hypothetical protein